MNTVGEVLASGAQSAAKGDTRDPGVRWHFTCYVALPQSYL